MKLEFSSLRFADIGKSTASPKLMWSKLELKFLDTDERQFPTIELILPVPKHPDVTYSQLQNAARDAAIELLRAALSSLESNDLTQLEKLEVERDGRWLELEEAAERT